MKAKIITGLLTLAGVFSMPVGADARPRNVEEIKAEIDSTSRILEKLHKELEEALVSQMTGQPSPSIGCVDNEDIAVASDQNYENEYLVACKELSGKYPQKALDKLIGLGKNFPKAWCKVGETYRNGIKGIKMDMDKAVDYFKKGADAGDAESMSSLATIYLTGENGIEKNLAEGRKYLEKAARAGDIVAMSNLGYAFQYGKFEFKKNTQEAVRWTRKAADKGDVNAQYGMYELYKEGAGEISKAQVIGYLEKILDKDPDNKKALAALGQFYLENKTTEGKGLEYLKKAASLGNVEAMEALADYLRYSNPAEAAAWAAKAQELNNRKTRETLSGSIQMNEGGSLSGEGGNRKISPSTSVLNSNLKKITRKPGKGASRRH